MVWYNPKQLDSPRLPGGFPQQLAEDLAQTGVFTDDVINRIRTSNQPLSEPIGYRKNIRTSLGIEIRKTVLDSLEDKDGVIGFERYNWIGNQMRRILTHPSVLEHANQLLSPPAVAKAYQYGYWLDEWRVGERDFTLQRSIEKEVSDLRETRLLRLTRGQPVDELDTADDDEWFSDKTAVRELAKRVCGDDIAWEQYVPWYRTSIIRTAQLERKAQQKNWTDLPSHPDTKPTIKDQLDVSVNPNTGDFIRTAIIQQLQANHPNITKISSGPEPWNTDTLSVFVDPTASNEIDETVVCPDVVLQKLAEYGYRPINGWYDTSTVGYESTDPDVPRRIEFARGEQLSKWCRSALCASITATEEDVRTVSNNSPFEGLDWETIITNLRSQITLHRHLHLLSQ